MQFRKGRKISRVLTAKPQSTKQKRNNTGKWEWNRAESLRKVCVELCWCKGKRKRRSNKRIVTSVAWLCSAAGSLLWSVGPPPWDRYSRAQRRKGLPPQHTQEGGHSAGSFCVAPCLCQTLHSLPLRIWYKHLQFYITFGKIINKLQQPSPRNAKRNASRETLSKVWIPLF